MNKQMRLVLIGAGVLVLAIIAALAVTNWSGDDEELTAGDGVVAADEGEQPPASDSPDGEAPPAPTVTASTSAPPTASTTPTVDELLVAAIDEAEGELDQAVDDYIVAYASFDTAGGIDPATMADRSALDARLDLATQFCQANEQALQTIARVEQEIEDRLTGRNLPPREVDQRMQQARAQLAIDEQRALHQSEVQRCLLTMDVLVMLRDEWDRWSYEPASDRFTFDNRALAQEYNGLLGEIGQILDWQAENELAIVPEADYMFP